MLWPNGKTTKPYVTSSFGPRNLANPNASKYHRGVDMVGFREVRAVSSGQVKVTGTPNGWAGGGLQVWVQHDGFFSRSLHLASYSVRAGQFVREGDVLGIMGTTPHVDLHLHLEISPGTVHYANTGQIDPVPFISARIGGSPAGGGSTPITEEGFLMALDDTQQRQVYEALVKGGYSGYYSPDAIIDILRRETAQQIAQSALFPGQPFNGFLALANNQAAMIEMLKVIDPSKSADIEAFEKKLRESEGRQVEAINATIRSSSEALRQGILTALENAGDVPAESVQAAVDAAFAKVFVQSGD